MARNPGEFEGETNRLISPLPACPTQIPAENSAYQGGVFRRFREFIECWPPEPTSI